MKILVTGAAGFIGSLLTVMLHEKGYDFIATDIAENPVTLQDILSDINYEPVNLCSTEDVKNLITTHKPTHILHVAGIMGGVAEQNPPLALQVNFMSTALMLDAGIKNGLERFVLATTIGVYDPNTPEPVKDNSIKYPANIYGISKLSSEYLLEWYGRTYNLSVGGARLPWVFGPGRSRGMTADLSTKLLNAIAREEEVFVKTPHERGDWMYGPDGARALLVMLNPGEKQKQFAYYFSGAGVHTVGEVMRYANKLCPSAKVTYEVAPEVDGTYAAAFDDCHTLRDLDWKPEYDLGRAINAHITTIQKQLS